MQLQIDGKPAFAYTAAHDVDPAKRSIVFVHGAGLDHSSWGLQSRYFGYHGFNVERDPDLAELRADPEFQRAVDEARAKSGV